jgi:serine/threonine protein phosphatase PrpC
MSRAGREPGFKKTNQDNCFAFEKYITEEQSLFGAMDGHGPQGARRAGWLSGWRRGRRWLAGWLAQGAALAGGCW